MQRLVINILLKIWKILTLNDKVSQEKCTASFITFEEKQMLCTISKNFIAAVKSAVTHQIAVLLSDFRTVILAAISDTS